MPKVNFLAVLVVGIAIFMLGGLWYSPVLFAKRWVALQGKSMEEMSGGAKPSLYLQVFVCGLLVALAMDILIVNNPNPTVASGVCVALLCWVGFTGATSYGTALFSFKPKALWLIDTGFNLVSMLLAGVILSVWH